jgi:hypothetical protein
MYVPHKLSWSRRLGFSLGLMALIVLLAPSAGIHALPDSRAYEMVSPLEKTGGRINGIDEYSNGGVLQAAPSGEAITYDSSESFACSVMRENTQSGAPCPPGGEPKGAPGSQYISSRQAGGWATQNITAPTKSSGYSAAGRGAPYYAFSPDLASALMLNGNNLPLPGSGAPEGFQNLYLRDDATGAFHALMTSAPSEGGEEMERLYATPDLTHIVIGSTAALTPGAVYGGPSLSTGANLYEWTAGVFQPINVLPGAAGNQTTPAAILGSAEKESHMVSNDGARAVWRPREPGPLYLREDIGSAQAHTVQIDLSEGTGVSGAGEFWDASADLSHIFFTDVNRLTGDSRAGGGNSEDLYEFNAVSAHLKDLSVDQNPADTEGARVQGVLGSSEDGSYVYYVATGALPQAAPNNQGEHPISGGDNLYVSHNGALAFIATLSENDDELGASDWRSNVYERATRVTPDGTHLVFMSRESLTGADNAGSEEIYLYDASTAGLTCVSCNPSGAVPLGGSSIPAATGYKSLTGFYESRLLTDDGSRVFFNSSDALVPQDINGAEDVYEWEADGTGACHSQSQNGGCVSLISGGTAHGNSQFVDAGAGGDDVFFLTTQQLVSSDTDEAQDLYDARVGGGFTPPPAPPVCSGTGCQGAPPAPPIFATPSSVTFAGEGNPAAAVVKPAVKPKALTRAQKLAVALRACGRKPHGKRAACRTQARKRYGTRRR